MKSYSDFYAFGSQKPGRNDNPGEYRYGYQGSEKETEAFDGAYSTHYRMLDSRIGRWFSVDPVTTPYESPYVSMGDNPFINFQPKGGEIIQGGEIRNFSEYQKSIRNSGTE